MSNDCPSLLWNLNRRLNIKWRAFGMDAPSTNEPSCASLEWTPAPLNHRAGDSRKTGGDNYKKSTIFRQLG
jgi:hypothetical protein